MILTKFYEDCIRDRTYTFSDAFWTFSSMCDYILQSYSHHTTQAALSHWTHTNLQH